MSQMLCENCGARLRAGALFCDGCAKPVSFAEAAPETASETVPERPVSQPPGEQTAAEAVIAEYEANYRAVCPICKGERFTMSVEGTVAEKKDFKPVNTFFRLLFLGPFVFFAGFARRGGAYRGVNYWTCLVCGKKYNNLHEFLAEKRHLLKQLKIECFITGLAGVFFYYMLLVQSANGALLTVDILFLRFVVFRTAAELSLLLCLLNAAAAFSQNGEVSLLQKRFDNGERLRPCDETRREAERAAAKY